VVGAGPKKVFPIMGNLLWLIGVDAPTIQKHISKCQKSLKKYQGVHPDILCSHMKFDEFCVCS
jgi:hypothetical protein